MFDEKQYRPTVGVAKIFFKLELLQQARSQDFLWGGAYLSNRDQIINVLNDTLC